MIPPTSPQQQVTQLLCDWRNGDEKALEKLIPLIQPELHRLAHAYMSRERARASFLDCIHLTKWRPNDLQICSEWNAHPLRRARCLHQPAPGPPECDPPAPMSP